MIIRRYLDKGAGWADRSRKVTQFSDSAVISFLLRDKSEVLYTVFDIQRMLAELVGMHMLCRGSIAYGKLLHTPNALFGPALNQAYRLESKAALYPHVVLEESIIKMGAQHYSFYNPETEEQYIRNCVGKDSDGPYYIDYFHSELGEFNNPTPLSWGSLIKLIEVTKSGLKSVAPGIRAKHMWLREKINPHIRGTKIPVS